MARRKQAKQRTAAAAVEEPLSGGCLWSIRVLAAVAMVISGYLLWGSLIGDHLPGCGPTSGCDAVLNSRWAYWFGIPVSLGALAAYAAVIGMTVPLARPSPAPVRRRYWTGLLGCALMVLGAAAWFVALQTFVIRAICPYCMTAHVCGAAMAIRILLVRPSLAPSADPNAARAQKASARPSVRLPALGAAAALAVLVAGQALYRPPTFVLQPMNAVVRPAAEQPTAGQAFTPRRPGTAEPAGGRPASIEPKPAGPFLDLHAGVFRLDLGEVPLIGRPEAPHVMVSLFDYTCSHCRAAHQTLIETHRALSNQLAIVSLPVPLDRACNATVRRPLPEHAHACLYARLGLAVWRADRRQMAAFDDWLFSFPKPPSTNAAWERATSLVGTNGLLQALNETWGDKVLQDNIRLYHTNYLRYSKGQLPQLIIGTNLVAGSFHSTPVLLDLVCKQFGLPVAAP